MLPKTQFSMWLRVQLLGQEESCRKIIVRHATATGRIGQVLHSIEVPNEIAPDDATWDEWITDQIDMIDQLTQADAEGSTTGVEKYSIQTFHGKENRATATFSIRVAAETNIEDDGISNEPATRPGLLAQMMRHNEAMARMTIIGTGNIIKAQNSQIAKYERVIDKLLEEKFETVVTVEQLVSQKHERDLETAKVEHEIEQKEKLFDKAMLLAPIIANKLIGRGKDGEKIIPEETTPLEQSVHSFASSLTEKQFEKLLEALDVDQKVSLLAMINSVNDKQAKLLKKSDEETDE